jgi:hypothetical protein
MSLVALVTLPVTGCSSGDDENMERISYKLPAATKLVSAKEAESVLEVQEGGTLVLASDSVLAGSIAPGDILMFGITPKTPDGLLRKVKSVARASGLGSESETDEVWIETDEATLEEAFEELDMVVDRDLEYEEMDSIETALEGLAIQRSPLSASRQVTFELNFDGTVLHDADGDKRTTNDQIVANGSIGFTLKIYLAAQIKWFRMEYIKAGGGVTQFGELEIRNTLAGLDFKKEVVVGTMYFAPFSLGPVVIRPRLQLVLGVTGKLSVQIVTSIEEEIGIEAGAIYKRGKGWAPYSNTWAYWDFMPPTLSASAEVKAYVGPRFTLLIYGVAGPWAQLAAYLRLVADTTSNPLWNLYGGLEGSVGIEGKILGFTFLKWRMDSIVDVSFRLAHAPCWCSAVECGPDPTCDFVESCGECEGVDICVEGECIQPCEPDCTGLECGPDPVCGQSCGLCNEYKTCQEGQCVPGGVALDTWYDDQSGLTWQIREIGEFSEPELPRDFAACEDLGPGWRAPSIDDLRTLIRGCPSVMDCGVNSSCLGSECRDEINCGGCQLMSGPGDNGCYWPHEMGGTSSTCYWSSSPVEDQSGSWWGVSFNTGAVMPCFSMNPLKCVSGGTLDE